MVKTEYSTHLDKTSRKFPCPSCGQKTFVRYCDTETKEYLADGVGRCDRENHCGHHYSPGQYCRENGIERKQPTVISSHEPPKPIEFLPEECFKAIDLRHRKINNFFIWLSTLFGWRIAQKLFSKYMIGTSRKIKGATIFFQVDENIKLRYGKVVQYDSKTGKRSKERDITGIHRLMDFDYNYLQTFFGLHLLTEYPDAKVCIVESEKTAVIASVYFPDFVWLATGAALGGCKWREYEVYKALKYRSVTWFPDYGYCNKKTGKTCFQEWTERVERIHEVLPGDFKVSDLLEKRLAGQERIDQDLADILLKIDSTGLALTEENYPVIWDLRSNF